MKLEFQRNDERYQFMKWGMQAFDTFKVVPPGHRHRAPGEPRVPRARRAQAKDGVYYPDTLVGTDCHTTMINGIGVVGWGVGGIEAEAGMLGQPVYFLTPDVVGVEPHGQAARRRAPPPTSCSPSPRCCARRRWSASSSSSSAKAPRRSSVPDRATIANMAPEYGATMGFFPVDETTIEYFRGTGRTDEEIDALRGLLQGAGPVRHPEAGRDRLLARSLELDLGDRHARRSPGPKRPQDRIELGKRRRRNVRRRSSPQAGRRTTASRKKPRATCDQPLQDRSTASTIGNGDVLIAAITSCTNTSNPSVLLAAGLLAKKAVELGLTVKPHIKTSLAPGLARGHRVPDARPGLLPYLEKLGFDVAAYGCTTCIGNAGALDARRSTRRSSRTTSSAPRCSRATATSRRASIPNLKANFLASPPLVVAYAIAGTVLKDLMTEPLGKGKDGKDVYLGDIWPTQRRDRTR